MAGGCGRKPVEVSWTESLFSGGNGGRAVGPRVAPLGGAALLLGRMSFLGLVERLRFLDGAAGAAGAGAAADHLGVATSELRTGRGIFLGWGGRKADIHRPGNVMATSNKSKTWPFFEAQNSH